MWTSACTAARVQTANACISVAAVFFCINNSRDVTKSQQEPRADKGLRLPEGTPTLWEKKFIRTPPPSLKCFISRSGSRQAYLAQTHILVHKLTFEHVFEFIFLSPHCLTADCCHVFFKFIFCESDNKKENKKKNNAFLRSSLM